MLVLKADYTIFVRLFLRALYLGLYILSSPAHAQGIVGLSPEAPPPYAMRQVGVNLSTTDIQLSNDDISVGSGNFPSRLTLKRTFNSIGYPLRNLPSITIQKQYTGFGQGSAHNLLAYFTRQMCPNLSSQNGRFISLTAVVLGTSYHFSGGGCLSSGPLGGIVNDDDEGALLRIINPDQSVSTYELITREGLRILFSDQAGYQYDQIGGRYANAVQFPDGEFIGFTYAASPSVSGTVRLDTVYNSRGYGLAFSYQTRAAYFPGNTLTDSSLITEVTSFKQTTAGRTNLAAATYAYDQSRSVVVSFQNGMGQTTRYTYDTNGRPTGMFLPRNQSTQPSMGIAYLDGVSQVSPGYVAVTGPGVGYFLQTAAAGDNVVDVAWSVPKSVTDASGNVTFFDFNDPTSPDPVSVTIRPPVGGSSGYLTAFCPASPACVLAPYFSRSPSDYVDGNGNRWVYKYDAHGRPVAAILPDGTSTSQKRDTVGNIIELRSKARPNSGLADIVSSAEYAVCTADNYKYCNKPTYTIDPRGGRWDFQYDSISGQLAVSLAPADANGLRAFVRYTYTAVAYGPVSVPSLIAPTSVYLLSTKDSCQASAVAGSNIDFSYVCPVASRVRESYSYLSSTTFAPSTYELVGMTSDADGVAASTSMTYDDAGNVTSSTDALGRTSYVTYDALRRKIFEIGPDPDGSGSLKRSITRHFYDDNGNEIRTEVGVGSQTDGSDFAVMTFVRRAFDLNDKLVKSEEVTP